MKIRLILSLVAALAFTFSAMISHAAGSLNINQATAAELDDNLLGIGLAKAQAIVNYRAANGPFRSLEDLNKIYGVGPKILENMRPYINFGAIGTENIKDTKAK